MQLQLEQFLLQAKPKATLSFALKNEDNIGVESKVLTTFGFTLPKIPD